MIYSSKFLLNIQESNFVKQLDEGVLTIDNSEYLNWDSCFAMGLYAGGLKRVAAKARAPLAFGGAVHAGLDAFFKGDPKWLDAALADAATTELDDLGDPKRNTSRLQDLLEAYVLEYRRMPTMQFNIVKTDGKPTVEQSFVVPLGTVHVKWRGSLKRIAIMWSGKIDLLTLYDNAITPVDHKTSTVLGEKFIDSHLRSNQMLGYTYASQYISRQLFDEKPVFGVRINMLAQRSNGFEFKVFDIPFPDWKVAEWQMETLRSIELTIQKLDFFLQHSEASPTREHCVTKYGRCPYFDVCDVPSQMRDRLIFDDSYYFVSDWSPLD